MIFLNSASSAAALVFYLPGVCTHTDTEGKQSPEYFLKIGKNTIFNEHPVPYREAITILPQQGGPWRGRSCARPPLWLPASSPLPRSPVG